MQKNYQSLIEGWRKDNRMLLNNSFNTINLFHTPLAMILSLLYSIICKNCLPYFFDDYSTIYRSH